MRSIANEDMPVTTLVGQLACLAETMSGSFLHAYETLGR